MDDGLFCAPQGLEGPPDQVFPGLSENFDGDVGRNVPVFDEFPDKTEFGFRGRGKGDFDFLETYGAKCLEHAHFLFAVHGFEQRLIAVAQVGAHPYRWLVDDPVWPLAIGEADGGEGVVFADVVLRHVGFS